MVDVFGPLLDLMLFYIPSIAFPPLRFVMSVVSPAVVVPSMLGLSDRGYGINKGIPTLVVAACSLDAVLAITGFGVMMGIVFAEGMYEYVFRGFLRGCVVENRDN